MVSTPLNTNIEIISSYGDKIADKIMSIKELAGHIEIGESKSGDPIIIYNGEPVDDPIDPVYKAIELFSQVKENDEDNVSVIFGLGLGYTFKKFAKDFKGKIIVFEPNLEIMRVVLEAVDFLQDFKNNSRSFFVTNFTEFNEAINAFFHWGNQVNLYYADFYAKNYPVEIDNLKKEFNRINPKELVTGVKKVNVGPGQWKKEGWKTLDCYIDSDIRADLRKCKPLPVADNEIEKVFSSHCIEHIETHHIQHLLKELYRCMKPGGFMRLSCPDIDQAFEAYRNDNIEWFYGIGTSGEIHDRFLNTIVSYEAGSGGPKQPRKAVDEKFNTLSKDEFIEWVLSQVDRNRPYIAHINGIYYEKLAGLLKEAGFIDIVRSSYRNSSDEELRGPDFDLHPTVSLFVECRKPE